MYRISVESAKALVCNQLSRSEWMLILLLLSSVNMLFSKTDSFISPFKQKLRSAYDNGVVLQFGHD